MKNHLPKILISCGLSLAIQSHATPFTWTGSTSNTWKDETNWNPNTDFPKVSPDVANFDGTSSNFTPTTVTGSAGNIVLEKLHVDGDITPYIISGNASNLIQFSHGSSNTFSNFTFKGKAPHILASPIDILAPGVNIDVDAASSVFINGVISGSGNLEKNGNGTLTIDGSDSNTILGTVNVNQGTLIFKKTPTKDAAISVNVHPNGILTYGASDQLPDNASLVIQGGSFVLGAFNDTIRSLTIPSGNFNVTTGILTLSSTGQAINMGNVTLANIKLTGASGGEIFYSDDEAFGTIKNIDFGNVNRTVNVNSKNSIPDLIIDGSQSTGGITKTGPGSLRLKNDHVHTGTTSFFNQGLTRLGNTFKGDIEINNGASFVLTNSSILTGNVTIIKPTSSLIINSNKNIVIGTITSDGTVCNNGLIDGNTTINPSGVLLGSGITTTAGQLLDVFGKISTGDCNGGVGVMTIGGDAHFHAGSVFEANISPNSGMDLLKVEGSLTIDGASIHLIPAPGIYDTIFNYEVITSGSITGDFDASLFTSSAPLFKVKSEKIGDFIFISRKLLPFKSVTTTPNQAAVAGCLDININFLLDDLNLNGQIDLQEWVGILQVADTETIQSALNQIHPGAFKALALSQQSNAIRMRSAITRRTAHAYHHVCKNPGSRNQFGALWMDTSGGQYKQRKELGEVAFRTNSGDVMIGVDQQTSENILVGVGVGYTFSKLNWYESRGDSDIQSGYAQLYATKFWNKFFLSGALQAGISHYDQSRNIHFANIDRTATSQFYGQHGLAHVHLGAIWNSGSWEMRPFLIGDFLYMHHDGVSEKGADSLNLTISHSHYGAIRAEAGLHLIKCLESEKFKLWTDLKLSYIREKRIDGENYKAELTNTRCTFLVKGLSPNRKLGSPGLSITWMSRDEKQFIRAGMEAEIGNRFVTYGGNLQGGHRF